MDKTSLIIGAGEVGEALYDILNDFYEGVYDYDKEDNVLTLLLKTFDIIHICFPYSKEFVNEVKKYQKKYNLKRELKPLLSFLEENKQAK